jgi:GcrA cell cycle regulator
MEWTEDSIARLKVLWAEGHSTAEIGRRIGVSKNAVVGKAHRLALEPRPSPIRRDGDQSGAPRVPAPRRVTGPTLPPMAAPEPMNDAVTEAVDEAALGAPYASGNDATLQESRSAPAVVETRPAAGDGGSERARPMPRVVESKPRPVAVPSPRLTHRTVTCCWPIGEPGTKTFRFCDAAAAGGKPYCADHAQLAYVKVRDRREDAA